MRSRQDPSNVWTPENQEGVTEGVAEVVFSRKPEATASIIESVKRLVKPKLAVPPSVFDRHPWLLGVVNGVLDLRTGTLLGDPNPELYLTKAAPAAFNPNASQAWWREHVSETFDDDDDLSLCFQKQLGAALVGNADTEKPQVFVFLNGPSGGGKGTTFRTLGRALGPHLVFLRAKDFTKGAGRHLQWMKRLDGASVAVVEEMPSDKVDVALLKTLSGGDPVIAHAMRQNDETWLPSHTLFFTANVAPNFDDDPAGMERRYVPLRTGPTREGDPEHAKRLLAELEGVLAWAVEGCLRWQEEDGGGVIALPESVRDMRDAHISDHDVFERFSNECLVYCEDAIHCTRSDIQRAYRSYLAKHGNFQPMLDTDPTWSTIYRRIDQEPGVRVKKWNGQRGWVGVAVKDWDDDDAMPSGQL